MGYGITANACEPGMRLAIFHSDIRTWEETAQFLGFYPSIDTPSTSCLIRAKPYWRTNFLTDLQKQKTSWHDPNIDISYCMSYLRSISLLIVIQLLYAIICYHCIYGCTPNMSRFFSVIDSENHQYCG